MEIKKLKNLFYDLTAHLAVTGTMSALLFFYTADTRLILLCVLGGILIDIDHLFDYFLCFGIRFNLKKFLCGEFVKSGRVYLFFHSWELLPLILICGLYFNLNWEAAALSLGMLGHLIIDSSFQKTIKPYFSSYRAWHRFKADEILPCMKNKKRLLKNGDDGGCR